MTNEYTNKVILSSGETLIDLTNDTATASDVVQGKTFHLANGQRTTGTYTETDPTVPSWAKQQTKPTYTATEVGADAEGSAAAVQSNLDAVTEKIGAANGIAELDSNGKVPSSQLPSYVGDVLEYSSISAFPATGESGKIYVATDTNKTYRWSGSAYVEISASLALGETSSTAYRGDRGKTAYDHSQNSSVHVTTAQKTEWSGKQDALPTAVANRLLHANASTGALEWIKRDVWAFTDSNIPTGGEIYTALQDGIVPVYVNLGTAPYRGIYICTGGDYINDVYYLFFMKIAQREVMYCYIRSNSISHEWDGRGSYSIITQHQSLAAYRTSAAQDVIDEGKQSTLVSGTNIKTINNQSILGSGNINLGGLPPVTSADEGSIPMVVDGTWQVVKNWIDPTQAGGNVTIQSAYEAAQSGDNLEVL